MEILSVPEKQPNKTPVPQKTPAPQKKEDVCAPPLPTGERGTAAARPPAGRVRISPDLTQPRETRVPRKPETPQKKPAPQKEALPKAKTSAAVTAVTLTVTLVLGVLTLLLPKKTVSETEKRVLAAAPAFSADAVMKGEYQAGAETYLLDHFAGRNALAAVYRTTARWMGAKKTDGVYIGREGHLFLVPAAVDDASVLARAEALNAFAAAHPEISCWAAVAPNAACVQRSYLPEHAEAPDQQALLAAFTDRLAGVKSADLYGALSAHADEYIYYLTDHHWTSLGAKYAFEALSRTMELGPTVGDYRTAVGTDRFLGTLSAKTGKTDVYDVIELYFPQTDVKYYVEDPVSGEESGSMFVTDALSGSDPYTVFFGGNKGVIRIRTTADTSRRLLVFKDSYANAFMQFLYPYFDEIVMVDPRYEYDSLQPLLRRYAFTDALWLYNADTFFSDATLPELLEDTE